jgi:hypothetical protein
LPIASISFLYLKAEVSVNDVTNAEPVTDKDPEVWIEPVTTNEPVISAEPLKGK